MLKLHILIGIRARIRVWIKLSFKSLNHGSFKCIQKHDCIFSSPKQNIHTIGRKFHRFNFFRFIFYRESLKRLIFIILSVEKMNHLIKSLRTIAFFLNRRSVGSHKKAREKLAHIIEASGLTFVNFDQTLLLLVFPHSCRPIFRAAQKTCILRI